jgi:hypothetical protein
LFSLSGPHNYPSPADISYGAAGPSGPVILVTSSAASRGGLTCNAASAGPTCGGLKLGGSSRRVFSNGGVQGVEVIPWGIGTMLPSGGTISYAGLAS